MNAQSIEEIELKLINSLEDVHFEKDDKLVMIKNDEFKSNLQKALLNKEIFNYPFDSLSKFMSTVISSDGEFRIFNWNIELEYIFINFFITCNLLLKLYDLYFH